MISGQTYRPSRLPASSRAPLVALGAVAAAGVAGYVVFHEPIALAAAFCVLPLLLFFLARPLPAAVFLGLTLPITYSITGGASGFDLAPSDLLLAFLIAAIFFQAVASESSPATHALTPIRKPVLQYSAFLAVLLIVHFGVHGAAQTAQRFELFLVPALVGALVALAGRHLAVLRAYVIGATVLAVAWPFAHALGQKNPVGQTVANAVLLLVGVKALRRFMPLLVVLVPGLVVTGSRGSILSLAVGAAVIFALQESRARTVATRLAVVGVIAFLTYALLPVSLQDRLTTLLPGTGSRGAYALTIRQEYAHDAYRVIKQHPVFGIGIGNYFAGSDQQDTVTNDPHDVLLLEAAEGGYLFALSLLVLLGGVVLALRRMRRIELAPVAAGVLLATFVHGLVDVYWVRGTPVLGWLLVGMVCGISARDSERPFAETAAP